jgi:hypothetical protein
LVSSFPQVVLKKANKGGGQTTDVVWTRMKWTPLEDSQVGNELWRRTEVRSMIKMVKTVLDMCKNVAKKWVKIRF